MKQWLSSDLQHAMYGMEFEAIMTVGRNSSLGTCYFSSRTKGKRHDLGICGVERRERAGTSDPLSEAQSRTRHFDRFDYDGKAVVISLFVNATCAQH